MALYVGVAAMTTSELRTRFIESFNALSLILNKRASGEILDKSASAVSHRSLGSLSIKIFTIFSEDEPWNEEIRERIRSND